MHEPSLPFAEVTAVLEPLSGAVTYSAGARIFDEADGGDQAYLIESGYVEIARTTQGKRQVLAVLGPGEIFGEMAVIDNQARAASAIAVHDAVLVPITRDQVREAIGSAQPLTRLLVHTAINRLRAIQGRSDLERVDAGVAGEATQSAGVDQMRSAVAQDVRLASELRSALAQAQFEVHLQPIVRLADGFCAGAEALVRWCHPERGMVSPAAFIPAAERTGLIIPIGLSVTTTALRMFASAASRRGGTGAEGPAFVSINVSPRQLDTESDVDALAKVITEYAADASRVKLEITEQALHEPGRAMAALQHLKATGASIAIDDFGTGYSSLSHLAHYPVDTLKIDRAFIAALGRERRGERVVNAVLGLARELEMDVVAEGVESREQLLWLQKRGCEYAQGYLLGKPAPATEVLVRMDTPFRW